jgi:hypothetical protein
LEYNADITAYNARGWLPFEQTRNPDIQILEKPIRDKLNSGDSLAKDKKIFFEESSEYNTRYQYIIVTHEEEKLSDNIIYDQLLTV